MLQIPDGIALCLPESLDIFPCGGKVNGGKRNDGHKASFDVERNHRCHFTMEKERMQGVALLCHENVMNFQFNDSPPAFRYDKRKRRRYDEAHDTTG